MPALFLRQYDIRQAAYPFDWNTTGPAEKSFDNLYKILLTDFADFCLKENLYINSSSPAFVQDRATGMSYAHDFLTSDHTGTIASNYLDSYDKIKEKYDRRIQRFRDTLSSNQKVIFLRVDDMGSGLREQTVMLRDLIQKLYPRLDFVLIQMGFDEDHKLNWGLERIETFYIPKDAITNAPVWSHPAWEILIKKIERIIGCTLESLRENLDKNQKEKVEL